MSFYSIEDRKRRDATIMDYLATVKSIKRQNMEGRGDLSRGRDLDGVWKLVVDSNREMVVEIVKYLQPIRHELEEINENIRGRVKHEIVESPPRKRKKVNVGPIASDYGSMATESLLAVFDKDSFDTFVLYIPR